MLCQQHWWLVPSLFLIIFSFCCFLPKSLLLTFHSGVPLKSWPFGPFSFKISHLFQTQLLVAFPFVIFPKWADSFLPGWKSSSYFPSWFFFLGSPRYQLFVHELLVSKLSGSFLHHWVADRDVSVLIPCVFLALLLSYLNLILALLHVPRIPSPWQSLGIPGQFLPLGSLVIFYHYWTFFFFPLFHEF